MFGLGGARESRDLEPGPLSSRLIRSGGQSLGHWLSEEHAILADYGKHIGGPVPGRIVQVWLIANSIIQQTEGEATFADISIGEGAKAPRVRVF